MEGSTISGAAAVGADDDLRAVLGTARMVFMIAPGHGVAEETVREAEAWAAERGWKVCLVMISYDPLNRRAAHA